MYMCVCLYMPLYVSFSVSIWSIYQSWMGSVKQSDDPGTAGVEKLEDHRTDR